METECSVPYSQEPNTGPYLKLCASYPIFLKIDLYICYTPIYVEVFQVVTFLQSFLLNLC